MTARTSTIRSLGVACAVVLALAACGSDGDDSATPTTAGATTAAGATTTAAAAATTAAGSAAPGTAMAGSTPVGGAADMIAAASAPVQFVSPGGPIDVSSMKGKTIHAITLDNSVPFVQAVLAGMTEAGKAAGVDVQIFDAKGSSSAAAQGIEQAIAAKAPAIVAFGVNLDLVAGAVKSANDAGIPVIGALNVDLNADMEEGAAGEVTIDYYESGKLLAAYAIANTDGPVHAAYQNLPSIATFTAMKEGVQDGFKELCPTDCSLKIDDLTQSDFKAGAETLTASEISTIDGLNWIFPAIDGMAQFTIPAVELSDQADKVDVGSINAFEANLQFIVDDRVQAVDVGNNNNWLGWAMLDRALRAIAGEPAAFSEVPIKLFDASNLQGKDLSNEDALFDGVDYRADYKALWQG